MLNKLSGPIITSRTPESRTQSEEDPKLKRLKRALAYHIKNEIKSEEKKVELLSIISKGELSKILHKKLLPSFEKIFQIEQAIKTNILIINYPEHLADEDDDNKNIEDGEDENSILYHEIKKTFGSSYDNLIRELKTTLAKVINEDHYFFKHRKKKNYDSINLIPKGNVIGGYHLIMIRYSPNQKFIRLEFIDPERHLQKYVNFPKYDLSESDNNPIMFIRKPSGPEGKSESELSITYETIEKVCFIAKKLCELRVKSENKN